MSAVIFWLLISVHVLLCLVLILLVLLQNDRAGGIASAFGGAGGGQAFTSAGAATFISKLTRWVAVSLIAVILGINWGISSGKFKNSQASAVKAVLQSESAGSVLRSQGAPEVPGVVPGVPGVPGVPQAPAGQPAQ